MLSKSVKQADGFLVYSTLVKQDDGYPVLSTLVKQADGSPVTPVLSETRAQAVRLILLDTVNRFFFLQGQKQSA